MSSFIKIPREQITLEFTLVSGGDVAEAAWQLVLRLAWPGTSLCLIVSESGLTFRRLLSEAA